MRGAYTGCVGIEKQKVVHMILRFGYCAVREKLIREWNSRIPEFLTLGFDIQTCEYCRVCTIISRQWRNYCSQLIGTEAVKISLKGAQIHRLNDDVRM